MASRADLNNALEEIMGNENVYFNPPETLKLKYPGIRYCLTTYTIFSANNNQYIKKPGYELTLIDRDPDSVYVDKIQSLPYCSFIRNYIVDNLNHWVFRLYQD